ncbi:hypothetical protein [Yersinia intermedia]|uniref:hypothetical protein n=1 Tax=Yersinia intermedia TaxID=631 RepID=UPI00119CA1A0|nr:hypothetical protein [Yersinia intermedia]MCB5315621.1 hypothetical protein [Yersinia intermedia]MCB5329408.1 hypothetical protein [Yersinia intermedia]
MVTKVLSLYCSNAPKDGLGAGEERIICDGPLYPDLLTKIDSISVYPTTLRAIEFIALHKVDLGDLRDWVTKALTHGKYINSQWCLGSSPKGLFACDSYCVSGDLYMPKNKKNEHTEIYVKVCITKARNAVAVLSFHPSY